jgi:energy-coupling factor transporter transmembrane protein EcfT
VLLLINTAMFAMTGNRSMIMYLVIALIVFINFRIRKISFRALIPVAIAGFVALNLLGTIRGSNYQDVDDFVEQTFSPSRSGDAPDKQNFFYTLTIGEFIVPFETLPQMMRAT